MAITSAIANSFKVEILQGGHNFNDGSGAPTGNTFKIALFSSNSASLSKSTTAYTAPSSANAVQLTRWKLVKVKRTVALQTVVILQVEQH